MTLTTLVYVSVRPKKSLDISVVVTCTEKKRTNKKCMLLSSWGHLVSIKCFFALIHSVTVDTLSLAMGCLLPWVATKFWRVTGVTFCLMLQVSNAFWTKWRYLQEKSRQRKLTFEFNFIISFLHLRKPIVWIRAVQQMKFIKCSV